MVPLDKRDSPLAHDPFGSSHQWQGGRGEETRSGTEKRSSHNCKAVTLRGGQRIIAVFSHSKYFTRSEPEEEMIKKLKT